MHSEKKIREGRMKSFLIPTHLSVPLQFETANVGRRALAFVIDMFIKWVYVFAVALNFNSNEYVMYVLIGPFVLYSFLFEWLNRGQTPGKMLMKIKVISFNGNLPSGYQCATRWVFNLVDVWSLFLFAFINPMLASLGIISPFIGLIIIVITKNNQRFGDMAANTVLIDTRVENVNLDDTIFAYSNYHQSYRPLFPEVMRLTDNDLNKIKYYAETAGHGDEAVIHQLAKRVKELLIVESELSDVDFLRRLLSDYNYFAKDAEISLR